MPALVLLFVLLTSVAPAQTRVDRRVNAIPAARLLSASPTVLVDPVDQRRARAVDDYRAATFLVWSFAPILAFYWLWYSGNAARLRDLLRRRMRTLWLVRAAFGAALGTLAWLAQVPFSFASHRIAAGVGLTAQTTGSWVLDELVRFVFVAGSTAVVVAVVLALVDRSRLWYLIFPASLYVVVLIVVAIEPVVLTPLTTTFRPAPAAIVAEGDALAHELGSAPVPIEIEATSVRSNVLSNRAAGLGAFDRILLGDTAVTRLSPGELRYLLALDYVLLREHAVIMLALIATSLFVFTAAVAVLISDRIGFRRDDDPLARLALVGTVLGLCVLAVYPVYSLIERGVHARADAAALAATRDPASLVRLLVRHADGELIALCRRRSERWYFDTRVPLGTHIAQARGTSDPCAP